MHDPRSDARESLQLLLVASAATLLLWFIPYVDMLLFPVRLFVTYVHELCHAVGALLTLGWPHEIEIYRDASGLTRSSGGLFLVVASAGYVGTPLVGAAMLLLAARRRMVRPTFVTAGAVLLVATLWLGGNVIAWVSGLLLGAGLVALGTSASPRVARFCLSFLAVQCMLGALGDLKTLLWLSTGHPEIMTDAQLMSEAAGGLIPPLAWTLVWSVLSLVILAVTLRVYFKLTVDAASAADARTAGGLLSRLARD